MATVNLVGVGVNQQLEVPEDCTVGKLRELADLNPNLSIRLDGAAASDDTPVRDGATAAVTAPSVKHGR
jgi:hypothetical protein